MGAEIAPSELLSWFDTWNMRFTEKFLAQALADPNGLTYDGMTMGPVSIAVSQLIAVLSSFRLIWLFVP